MLASSAIMYFLDYFSANITLLNFRCKCGNCNIALLQNISECYCCCELEDCEESMKSDLVLQDLAPDVNLTCITEHPGFQPVCLQKWSLRLAADCKDVMDRTINANNRALIIERHCAESRHE